MKIKFQLSGSWHQSYDNLAVLAVLSVLPAGGLNNQSSVSVPRDATFWLRPNWGTYGFVQYYGWLQFRGTGAKYRRRTYIRSNFQETAINGVIAEVERPALVLECHIAETIPGEYVSVE